MAADTSTNATDTCPDCGAVVADAALHRSWHTELPRAISKAVVAYVGDRKT